MTEAGEMLSFWQSAARRPDRVALVEPDGTQRTAGELLASANQIVHGLRARGLSEGDCVALSMTNCGRVLELYLAGLASPDEVPDFPVPQNVDCSSLACDDQSCTRMRFSADSVVIFTGPVRSRNSRLI